MLEMTVGFAWAMMSSTFSVRNPRTGVEDFSFTSDGPKEVRLAAMRARKASVRWLAAGVSGRVAEMKRFRDGLVEEREEMVEVLSQDTGRVEISALEVDAVVSMADRR